MTTARYIGWQKSFAENGSELLLTKEEYTQYERGDTGKTLKKRLDDFLTANLYEEFYSQLIDSVEARNSPAFGETIGFAVGEGGPSTS